MYRTSTEQKGAHADSIWSLDWASNGMIATAGLDETVRLWQTSEVKSEQVDMTDISLENTVISRGHALGATCISFGGDSSWLAASALDSNIRILDVQSGEVTNTLECGPLQSWQVSANPRQKVIATGSQNGAVHIWDAEAATIKESLQTHGGFLLCVKYSNDGSLLACGSSTGCIYVFDTASNKLLHTLQGHTSHVRSLAFDHSSRQLYSVGDDGKINLFDIGSKQSNTGSLVHSLQGHSAWVLTVDVSPTGQHIATGSADKTVKVWDIRRRECAHTFTAHSEYVWDVKYNDSGSKLASTGDDARICIHSVQT